MSRMDSHRHLSRLRTPQLRGVPALAFCLCSGLAIWACLDGLEPDRSTVLADAEADHAVRADAELERLLALVRDGRAGSVRATGLGCLLVLPSDARPADTRSRHCEEPIAGGLDADDLLDAATRRFGPGLSNFAHEGSDLSFVDHARAERVSFSIHPDDEVELLVEPWVAIEDFIGAPGPTFGFERHALLGATRPEIEATYGGPDGAVGSALWLVLPQTELGTSGWVGYGNGVVTGFAIQIHYGDDPASRLRILGALEHHFGAPVVALMQDDDWVSLQRPGGYVHIDDHEALAFVNVFVANRD